jgi:toxin ParE1/3/4
MKLRYTRRARIDIDGIHDWISRHNPQAAAAVVDRIRKTAELLSEHPGLGRETDIPGIRVLSVPRCPYLVYHTLEGDEVVIIHVRHGARAAPVPGEF